MLVLSFPSQFDKPLWIIPAYWYFTFLIAALAITSSSSVFANMVIVQEEDIPKRDEYNEENKGLARFKDVMGIPVTISLFGLLVVIPLLIARYNGYVAFIVIVFELIFVVCDWYFYTRAWPPSLQ